MKQIKTAVIKEKERKKNNLILAVIMIMLIGLSTLGYAIMNKGNEENTQNVATYGGIKFVNSDGYWITEINQKNFYFSNLPQEIGNVSIQGNFSFEDYYSKAVYIVNYNQEVGTLISTLNGIALRIQEACLNETNCTNLELPVKTCDDALIVFRNPEAKTSVTRNNNCVFIEGEFSMGIDKFIYRMLNIA